MARIVVDPVTRIEGHLRIEAQVDGGAVRDAWSSSTMWRGIESILTGRDPRDAWYFAQRICGVCTTVHALASVRAVEDALGIEPPPNAKLLRGLIAASQFVQDHVVHFYHLHALDWVDVTSALDGDPAKAAKVAATLSDYPRSGAGQFKAVRDRLRAFVRIYALLGGKNPHPQTYLVGGMAVPIDPNSQSAINADTLAELRVLLNRGLDFVRQAYVPDLLAIASHYPEWTKIGRGLGNYLAFGDFAPALAVAGSGQDDRFLPGGVIRDGDLSRVEPVDTGAIAEYVTHSWYRYERGDQVALPPFEGETVPNYTGPEPPYEQLETDGKYSWLKAPRYRDVAMEVGPLARMLIAYASGHQQVRGAVDGALGKLRVGPEALLSTLGRTAARGVEALVLAEHAIELLDQLEGNIAGGDLRIHDGRLWEPATWPKQAQGAGLEEAPRGALSHWVVIKDRKIARYQAVVPSTWNASPRDAHGRRGAYETALLGTPIADPKRPLEILRTVHSFDPCMACAAHVLDAEGREVVEVRVQ